MRKLRALVYGLGAVVALVQCGPLSSRDKPGGSAGLGGEGGDDSGGGTKNRAGADSSNAGEPSESGSGGSTGGAAAGAPAELGGAAGESSQGGSAGEPEPDGPVTIAEAQSTPTGIALDAQYVYWANRDPGTIVRCPRRGCGNEDPEPLVSGAAKPLGVAVDATSVYWIETAAMVESVNTGRVYKCAISGCAGAAPTLVTQWQVGNRTNDLHVADGQLYIAAWPMLGTCSIAGCAMPTNIGGGPYVGVDTNSDSIYAGRYGSQQIVRCPLGGCDPMMPPPVIAKSVWPLALSVDESYVYFANHDYFNGGTASHEIARCPLDGCGDDAPEVVVPGDGISPYGLTASSTRLYFTNVVEGSVMSVPKSP
jgi:hypothetical protein